MMMPSILFYFFLSMSTPTPGLSCSLELKNSTEGEVSIDGAKGEVSIISEEAELEKCQAWPEIENYYAVELVLGEGGTSSISRPVHLLILKKDNNQLTSVFEHYLGDASARQSQRLNYDLQVNGSRPVLNLAGDEREIE